MALKNFKGSGFFTNTVGVPLVDQISLYENRMLEFDLTKEVELKEVHGVVDGNDIPQLIDTYFGLEKYTLKTSTESVDSSLLALMTGEAWATTASYNAVGFIRTSVPSAGPYEITSSKILSTFTADDIQVTIVENGTWGAIRQLEVVTTGTPTVDQVELDAATGKLTFATGNAGATVKIAYKQTYTNKKTLGVETKAAIDNLKFVGLCSTTRGEDILIVIPKFNPSGGWQLKIGGDSKIDLDFRCVTSGSNRSPVHFLAIPN